LLTDLGHRRIALVNGLEVMTFAAHRRVTNWRCGPGLPRSTLISRTP
jgi:hypothetical protein